MYTEYDSLILRSSQAKASQQIALIDYNGLSVPNVSVRNTSVPSFIPPRVSPKTTTSHNIHYACQTIQMMEQGSYTFYKQISKTLTVEKTLKFSRTRGNLGR